MPADVVAPGEAQVISGPQGPQGAQGPGGAQGPTGPQGVRGTKRWHGDGPPGTIIGSSPGDEYIDDLTGTIYLLR